VLKTQVQSALRGDVEPVQALHEINHTVARATELANQMLALAKVEQLRQQGDAPVLDWAGVIRAVALDLAPLMAEHRLDFSIATTPSPVRAHEWALRELVRNLLHNAIKHAPDGTALTVALAREARDAVLRIDDQGAGISADLRQRLFQPFAVGGGTGDPRIGSGLGLAIGQEIVLSLGGSIVLDNRMDGGEHVVGLSALVRLPVVDNPP
jgi:two-component system sensor histidine kinase TctE